MEIDIENGALMSRMLEINSVPGIYNKGSLKTTQQKDHKSLNLPYRVNQMKKVVEENQVYLLMA